MYILDTNVISAVRRPDRAPQVAAWLRGKAEQDLFLSVITLGEVERGIRQQEIRDPAFANDLRNWLDRTVLLFSDRLLAFEAEDARIWGRLSAEIGHDGADLMIAASALRHGAVVVTGNVSDFAPTGAAIENPF
ncbi:type II toxin-antitoxin system VapC family toxin [Rhodobacteraceae bacterium HSP-20]|uniref:Ribonuclease VapC n=1 Tax=Paragemmobacter amnigenus TaxID=2852097 RepID=A0ABS6J6S0_9RHOB|nr:type II toxin-antitoxin system VapC family toxin [Rhodobacter amnigenus]MBU9698926.1 type II toxin-antitoxin system VapC family toxin [Rhodobacter amnigenus]MBV4390153.1 type II toxin-antitoxin system VapC family toxin [Rhodobacter amnigenus]